MAQHQALLEPSASERDRLRNELAELKCQLPSLRRDRDELRTEMIDLSIQIPALREERDELLAAAVPLTAEVADLESKQEELISLRSEIQSLRGRKSSLEKSLATRGRPTESIRRGATGTQRFHDS